MSYLNYFYETFKVPENASIEEIEEAFRKLKSECAHDESKKDHVKLAEFMFDEIMSQKKNLPNYQARINKSKNELLPQNREESARNESTDNNNESANVKNLVKRFQTPHPNTHPNENFSSSKSVRQKSAHTSGGESKINEPDKSNIAIKPSLKNVNDVVRPSNPNLDKTQNRDSSNQNPKATFSSANNLTGKEQTQYLNFSETKSNEQNNVQEQLNELNIENIHIIDNETVNLNEAQKLEKETKLESNPEPKNPVEQKRKPATSQNNKKTLMPLRQRKIVPKCPPLEHEVELTLEEVFNGGTKTVNVIRKMEMIGKVLDNPKDFPIVFSPGVEADTRFDFLQEGNKSIKLLPGDLVLIIKDRPEQYFKRINQCDVEYRARVLRNVDNANDVHQIDVPMFDNEPLVINIKENEINVDTFQRILGRGLPRTGDAKSRGDLLVRFELIDTLDDVEVQQKINQDKQIKDSTTNGNKKAESEFTNSQIESLTQNSTEKKVESQKPKRPVTHLDLELSLNEVLNGCKKSMIVDIKRSDRGVTNNVEEKTFKFDIKPGVPTGFEFAFEKNGDPSKNGTLADIIFTVSDAPHPHFIRNGSEIRYVAKVSPSQFKNNDQIEVPTLENTTLKVKLDKEIESSKEKRFFGRGLPYLSDTRMRGGLLIQFEMVSEVEAKEFAKQIIKIQNQIKDNKNETSKNENVLKDMSTNVSTDKQQLPSNQYDLLLSLEEIYRGCLKRRSIKRKILNGDGTQNEEEEVQLEIPVMAGSIEGTKITIEKGGDREFAKLPAVAIFTVQEETHSLFKRDGLDIIYTANITPREAINGCSLKIPTLNHETITVPTKGGITPETIKRMENYGIPKLNNEKIRGNMLIRFNIIFGKETEPTLPTEIDLSLTLRQILHGDIVKQSFTRKVFDGKNYRNEQKSVNIDIKRGTQTGTRFTFPREGNQESGKIPADVIFVARDEPHDIFKRNGVNLEYTAKIQETKLVNGGNIDIPTLENETRSISIDQITEGSVKRISKYGLPYFDNPEKRGDILVRFEIISEKPKPKDSDIEIPLPLTLENILNGCTKRLNINRRFYIKNEEEKFEDKIVEIEVKPGTHKDTKLQRFVEHGDENIGSIPGDIVFIAKDKPNYYFKREGANIIHNALITRYEAFTGVNLEIPTLNPKKALFLPIKNFYRSNNCKVYPGEGLPMDPNSNQRGDLLVYIETVDDNLKDKTETKELPISLNDVLNGCTKTIVLNKTLIDQNGKFCNTIKEISIDIKPGMRADEKFTFQREGNHRKGYIPGDIVFVVTDEPHEVFRRFDANLLYIHTIKSSQASKPFTLKIQTLENEKIELKFDKASKFTREYIYDKGLPYFWNNKQRGKIEVMFEIIDDGIDKDKVKKESPVVEPLRHSTKQDELKQRSYKDVLEGTPKNKTETKDFKFKLKYASICHEVALTLLEIFNGCSKDIILSCKAADGEGKQMSKDFKFNLLIKPGIESGKEIGFTIEGHDESESFPDNVKFLAKEIPHEHFTRNGADLHYTLQISNFDSMMGFEKPIPTLEMKKIAKLKTGKNEPINSKSVRILEELGLPYFEKPEKRGNIVVKFEVSGPNTESNKTNTEKQSYKNNQIDSNNMTNPTNSKTSYQGDNQANNSNQKSSSENKNKPNPSIKMDLPLTLENILHGFNGKFKYKIKIHSSDGAFQLIDKVLDAKVNPGAMTGQEILFKSHGHQFPDSIPSDLILVVQDKPHNKFVRNGINLIYIAKVDRKKVYSGCQIHVPKLGENETTSIFLHKQTDLNRDILIENQGLPYPDNTTKRGDLLVRLKINDDKITEIQSTEENKQEKELPKDPPKEFKLWLTLEEILHGCVKKLNFMRVATNSEGIEITEPREVTVEIKPGTETGKRFIFEGEGDQIHNEKPDDIVFVVHDNSHNLKRRGADVSYKATISSTQANAGKGFITIPTLEGNLFYELKEKVSNLSSIEIEHKGLPYPDDPSKRGRLILLFDIVDDFSSNSSARFNFFEN